ncbi:MAG: hypothetical protein MZU97_00415 [Bacillus subtilis]|nr:hypothetical protein [Bacillus subtilis]
MSRRPDFTDSPSSILPLPTITSILRFAVLINGELPYQRSLSDHPCRNVGRAVIGLFSDRPLRQRFLSLRRNRSSRMGRHRFPGPDGSVCRTLRFPSWKPATTRVELPARKGDFLIGDRLVVTGVSERFPTIRPTLRAGTDECFRIRSSVEAETPDCEERARRFSRASPATSTVTPFLG